MVVSPILETPEVAPAMVAALDARPADARVGVDPDVVEFFSAEAF
jgi:hypothetical protein